MLRANLAVAATLMFALLTAPSAEAVPKFCDNHGTGPGQVYKHACAGGDGGSALWRPILNKSGHAIIRGTSDGNMAPIQSCRARCGGGRHGVRTTEPF